MSKKGLGNNPLAATQTGQDELIRTTGEPTAVAPATTKPAARMVPKSLQIDSLLNERLRRFAFDTRTKEAQIIRDALHAWLAAKGF